MTPTGGIKAIAQARTVPGLSFFLVRGRPARRTRRLAYDRGRMDHCPQPTL